jgi:hypothetical protein
MKGADTSVENERRSRPRGSRPANGFREREQRAEGCWKSPIPQSVQNLPGDRRNHGRVGGSPWSLHGRLRNGERSPGDPCLPQRGGGGSSSRALRAACDSGGEDASSIASSHCRANCFTSPRVRYAVARLTPAISQATRTLAIFDRASRNAFCHDFAGRPLRALALGVSLFGRMPTPWQPRSRLPFSLPCSSLSLHQDASIFPDEPDTSTTSTPRSPHPTGKRRPGRLHLARVRARGVLVVLIVGRMEKAAMDRE